MTIKSAILASLTFSLLLIQQSPNAIAATAESCSEIYKGVNSDSILPLAKSTIIENYIADSLELVRILTEDHKKVLTIYYQLKKNSITPHTFFNPIQMQKSSNINASQTPQLDYLTQEQLLSISEFNWKEYLLFQDQIDHHPLLQNNIFLKYFKQYGNLANRGATNDVMQRVGFYLEDKYGFLKNENPKLRIMLLSEISQNAMGIALAQAKIDFNKISNDFGYIHNQANASEMDLARWQNKMSQAIEQLKSQQLIP
jgi:hypothetical protein